MIGSGYCQIIGPLVPSKVNNWNQKIGIQLYQSILNRRPHIALINEMAFSSSLIDLYHKFQYQGIAMDEQNLRLALSHNQPDSEQISKVLSPSGIEMPILATDTILFQKLQHYTHGDISMDEYLDFIKKHRINKDKVICVYSNDAEVFDYRPGRFKTEKPTFPGREWNRLKSLLMELKTNYGIEFLLPSDSLKLKNQALNVVKISNASYPVPVKKQAKYNIARWCVTGRRYKVKYSMSEDLWDF